MLWNKIELKQFSSRSWKLDKWSIDQWIRPIPFILKCGYVSESATVALWCHPHVKRTGDQEYYNWSPRSHEWMYTMSPFNSCYGSSLISGVSASRWRYRESQQITKVRICAKCDTFSCRYSSCNQVQVTTVLIRLRSLDTRTTSCVNILVFFFVFLTFYKWNSSWSICCDW